jgi:hypothetical protein
MDDPINIIKQIVDFGALGLSLYLNFTFWRAYRDRTRELIDTLREVAGLRVQLVRSESRFLFPTADPDGTNLLEQHPKQD